MIILTTEEQILKYILETRDCKGMSCLASMNSINRIPCPLKEGSCSGNMFLTRVKEKLEEIEKLDFLEKLK